MDADPSKPLSAFGFLTIRECPEHGLFGGYLILSPLGRPLEFRCTAPITPSRAQEILYGPTLRRYLLADVIGQALVEGAEIAVAAILTDQRDMLALEAFRNEEMLHVEPMAPADRRHHLPAENDLIISNCRVTPGANSRRAAWEIESLMRPLTAHLDLMEPFERVRAALAEAQRASHDAPEDDDARQAA
jgi:hypothetical protein